MLLVLGSHVSLPKGRMMRRITTALLGAFAAIICLVVIPATSASAWVCDNSPGATQDDAVCGYVNSTDQTNAVLDRISDLQAHVNSLNFQVLFLALLLIVVTICVVIQTTLAVRRQNARDERKEDHAEAMPSA